MPEAVPDAVSRRLLGLLQSGFPMTREPYRDLGAKLGIAGEEVMRRIWELKEAGIVRQISPVLDARRLGYQSTLVALKVPGARLAGAEKVITAHPGISHGYQREHEFNIWVTLSVPPGASLRDELKGLSSATHAEAIFALAALRVFKLRTDFSDGGDAAAGSSALPDNKLPKRAAVSAADRKIINMLQQDLPLCSDPFAGMAASLEMSVPSLLVRCRSLLRRGIMRRYGASINHYRAGYTANAMTCWAVPAGCVESMGKQVAGLKQVSHCYERETNQLWHYNLFAMLHGRSRAACSQAAGQISADTGINDFVALFSTREFKKTRVLYRV